MSQGSATSHGKGTAKTTRDRRGSATPTAASPAKKRASGFERTFERIYRVVLKIPRGRVMTYGQIARLFDERFSPRLVGWAMHATPHDERNIPWHRVINSRGGISTGRVQPAQPDLQQWMLEAEGVVFDELGRCDLDRYLWSPSRARKNVIGEQGRKKRRAH